MDADIGHRLITNDDGKQHPQAKSLERSIVSEIKPGTEHDGTVVKVQSQDENITFRQQFCRSTTSPVKERKNDQVIALGCNSSYEDFWTLDETQTPHPSGAPIYVFQTENGTYLGFPCILMT